MIFSELYSAYYNAVAAILAKACDHPLSKAELRGIIMQKAFGESLLSIEPALLEERWQLLKADGTTPIRHAPTMPLTVLQRRWLKAITLDPRIRLFPDACFEDPDVEPLFRQEDIDVFDRYSDGDPFEDETYIRHFRLILDAIRNRVPLAIDAVTGKGETVHHVLMPDALEYSEKDDKIQAGRPRFPAPVRQSVPDPALQPEKAGGSPRRSRRNRPYRKPLSWSWWTGGTRWKES